jgi:hypothetical protein
MFFVMLKDNLSKIVIHVASFYCSVISIHIILLKYENLDVQ